VCRLASKNHNAKKPKLCIASPVLEKEIQKALAGYKKTWESEEKVFEELCFCLLTPQSSAHRAFATIEKVNYHTLKGVASDVARLVRA